MLSPSVYQDGFARDNLPSPEQWPVITDGGLPELAYPARFNAAVELLDRAIDQGWGNRPCLRAPGLVWSYAEVLERANRVAGVLVNEMGLRSGNRVLLRGANNPMMAVCWFAVLKAGGIAVTTMPLLRARELTFILDKAKVEFALCDAALSGELEAAREKSRELKRVVYFHSVASDGLEALTAHQNPRFDNVIPARDDVALIAFTSGTTGQAKGTMHFHSDVLAICDCFPRSILKPEPDDIFSGSPPLAFTFGLGGILLFPMRFGASTLLIERCAPPELLQAIQDHRLSTIFTAPTAYRAMADLAKNFDISSLSKCVSAGEHLSRRHLRGLAPGDGNQDHRRAGLDRTPAHLRLIERRGGAPRRHRQADPRLPGDDRRRRYAAAAGGPSRPARGARPDRLPLSRQCRAAAQIRARRLESDGRRLSNG